MVIWFLSLHLFWKDKIIWGGYSISLDALFSIASIFRIYNSDLMKGIAFIIGLITLVSACNLTRQQDSLMLDKELTFTTGFHPGYGQLERIDGEEFICFSDFRTHKEVVLHHTSSEKVHRIDLSPIYDLNEKVAGVEIISLDTILAITERTNKLFMIDHMGEIWRTVDLNPYVKEVGHFELYRCATPFQFNDTTLIFAMEYGMRNLPIEAQRDFLRFNTEKYNSFNLFKIDNIFNEELKVSFGLKGLYNHFTDAQHIAMEGSDFTFFEDRIVYKSWYSDSLYLINPSTLTIDSKVAIRSEFSSLHITPITIEEERTIPNALDERFKTGGFTLDISYDKLRDIYYLITAHRPFTKNDEDRPWSVIILDGDFNRIEEIKMDDSRYYHHGFISDQGLFISNYYESLDDKDHFSKNTYALFQYE